MYTTAKPQMKLIRCWKHIDANLKDYIREGQQQQPDSTTGNSCNDNEYYMTLLNGWPYCNTADSVHYYLSYIPSFEHKYVKGSGISLRYDEWIQLLALIPAINRERRTIN